MHLALISNSAIWPIDRALSGATTPGKSGTGSDDNEGILRIPQSLTIRLFNVIYPGHSSADMQLVYSTTPINWAIWCVVSAGDFSNMPRTSPMFIPYYHLIYYPFPLISISYICITSCTKNNIKQYRKILCIFIFT